MPFINIGMKGKLWHGQTNDGVANVLGLMKSAAGNVIIQWKILRCKDEIELTLSEVWMAVYYIIHN